MTNAQPNTVVNTGAPKIVAKDIHAKWDKISDQEAGNVKRSDDLVSMVKVKYSLSQEQAQTDVNTWANGRGF
jgi:hypothetical protein